MKLDILSQSLNTGSPYATPAFDVLSSTSSQVCPVVDDIPAVDDSPAEDPLPDDLQAQWREKIKLQIKVLGLQQEYYTIALKKTKTRLTNKMKTLVCINTY
ncbi:hypothetical protein ABG768_015782 [Culter alburnus]|uniref:Uncharacterized protein n=1 Tax=Culter alburnus TaxID=194366 RepID=A0AAW1Z3D0_CULAL